MKNQQSQSVAPDDGDHKSNWVLGIFYFNTKDKRLFPPKRVPILGWTINFANPYSILIGTAICVGVLYIGSLFRK